ncbi:hypothetical protein DL96DRAFT_89718 [Flagelloscypha sp. PMI_526]|nr:hypothetical protein DL96DRAFT_89718 [Flagelloscypha sp. PMI_526]
MLHTSADSLLSSLSLQPSQSTNAWFACSDIPALKTRIELTTCNYMKPSMASTVSMIVYRCIHNECCGTISFEIYASEQPYDVMVMLSYDHPVQHHDSPRRLPQPELATKPAAQEEAQPTTESPPAVVESKVTEVVQIDLEPQAPCGGQSGPVYRNKTLHSLPTL